MVAYACVISEENFPVIASEKPDFNREEIIKWLEEHKQGYFLRDPDSAGFDCKFLATDIFLQFYKFESQDVGSLFRRVLKL